MLLSKIVAPQKWEDELCTETCHGIGLGASSPPTIFSSFLLAGGKKDGHDGIFAESVKWYDLGFQSEFCYEQCLFDWLCRIRISFSAQKCTI